MAGRPASRAGRQPGLLADLATELLPRATLAWPEATFFGWLDCRTLDLHDELPAGQLGFTTDLAGPARMFLDRARVALTSGHVFGSGGGGFVRINCATNPTIIRDALLRMAEAVDTLPLMSRDAMVDTA